MSVTRPAWPAALKIPETWAPEWPGTERVTGAPTWAPPLKIVNVTSTAESSRLNTPTLVRKPALGPPLRIEVRTVVGCASEFLRPGMNMPTVGVGAVE